MAEDDHYLYNFSWLVFYDKAVDLFVRNAKFMKH